MGSRLALAVSVVVAIFLSVTAHAFEFEPPPQTRTMGVPEDTSELLIFLQPGTDAAGFAREHGLTVKEALKSDPNAYVFVASSINAAVTTFENNTMAADARVRFAGVNRRTAHKKMFVPNDPYFHRNTPAAGWAGQWHLTNEWTSGLDIRAQGAWDRDITGNGVIIGIVDDCLQTSHPDLAPNYVAADSWDFGQGDNNPSPVNSDDQHGISVSGVAAARGGNGVGVTGVAPYAGLAGLRIDFPRQTTAMFVDATLYHSSGSNTNIKVKNHSYGLGVEYIPSAEEENALVTSANAGTIHCLAAGNERGTSAQDSNVMDLQNNPKGICVAALGSNGKYANYSNFGACIACCAPSSAAGLLGITTTDRTGSAGYNSNYGDTFPDLSYTSIFGGTSSASPTVAGTMALVKQVQPALDVRFAKHLLALTCDIVDASDTTSTSDGGWRTNSAGIHFNQNYGFGLINADALTQAALNYSGVTPLATFDTGSITVSTAIPNNNPLGVTRTFNVSSTTPMEEVEVRIVAHHSFSGDLLITLTSPSGYSSRLVKNFFGASANPLNWWYTTNAFWGENPAGTWTIKIADVSDNSSATGTWDSYRLIIHMGELIPNTGPTVIQQPQPQSLCPGDTATFMVGATGTGTLSYQWQKNATNLTNGGRVSGADSTTLQIINTDSSDVASYRCVVSDDLGNRISNSAALSLVTTTITSHPANRTITEGQTTTFTVSATGKGSLAYQWQKNGVNVTNGGHYSGTATATLTIIEADGTDVASYRCVVTGDCGSATSNAATLTVNPPGPVVTPINFSETWDTYAEGTTDPAYVARWLDVAGTNRYEIQVTQAAAPRTAKVAKDKILGISHPLAAEIIAAFSEGTEVRGTDANPLSLLVEYYLNTSGSYTLADVFAELSMGDVRAPSSNSATVLPVLAFGMTAGIHGAAGYPRFFDGKNWNNVTSISISNNWNTLGMAVKAATVVLSGQGEANGTSTLARQYTGGFDRISFRTVWNDNAGRWRAIDGVSLSGGEVYPPATPPTITGQPQPQGVCAGGSATFTVTATGSGSLTYQWQHDGANLTNGGHYSGATTPSLLVSGADAGDVGSYRCKVSNNIGPVYSNTAALSIKPTASTDLDQDCDVDADDFSLFAACNTGPMIPVISGCETRDFDGDEDVDLEDFGLFQRCYTGPDGAIEADCMND